MAKPDGMMVFAGLYGDVDAAKVHHEYARARKEFHDALLEATAFYHPGAPADVERECARLIDLAYRSHAAGGRRLDIPPS